MSDIDPRDFGRLEAEVTSLTSEVAGLRADVTKLLEMANRSRGALWAGMSIASMGGGLITYIASHWHK